MSSLHTDLENALGLEIWHHRRPEYWWGVAWLPEFWLTVVLGVGLLWSLLRDRKMRVTSAARMA